MITLIRMVGYDFSVIPKLGETFIIGYNAFWTLDVGVDTLELVEGNDVTACIAFVAVLVFYAVFETTEVDVEAG
jgi:hypothetical protein